MKIMAKSLKLKNSKYWDGSNIVINKTTLPTYLSQNYFNLSGGNCTYTVYGKTGADQSTGYRLIFSGKMGVWAHIREVYQISSRHLGTGFYMISINNQGSLSNNDVQIKYYGTTNSLTEDSLVGYYNSDDGYVRLFMKYNDYSPANITRFCPYLSRGYLGTVWKSYLV